VSGNSSLSLTKCEQFEEELTATVRLVLNHLDSEGVTRIVQHLLSDKVGATCQSDLQYVTAEMLPPEIIPPIKANQLLRYFSTPGPSASGSSSQGTVGLRGKGTCNYMF